MAALIFALFVALALASWSASPVDAFAGSGALQRRAVATDFGSIIRRDAQILRPRTRAIRTKNNDDDEEEGDPLSNDQREGMADAFAGLDGLTADDFDDLKPMSMSSTKESSTSIASDTNMEESAKLFMEMSAELSTRGEEGVYDDIMGDLTSGDPGTDAPPSYLQREEDDVTVLGQALDEAADVLAAATTPAEEASVLDDADGIGTSDKTPLTTADVTTDILTQEVTPSLSMEEFMSSAIQEAVTELESSERSTEDAGPGRTDEIAKTAEQLLEDEELRKEIEAIFDKAGEKLRLEVDAMKREQEALTQGASKQGLEYLELEKQRISEAEESVSRLIQKVARETDAVQQAMEDLELAKNQASGEGSGSIEDTALDLKKGGIVKQASLVGLLLFGSRAVTETILVVSSPYGEQHFVPAALQAAIALACAAYFFLVK
ncbi:hypothetical protein ACHAXT_010307 [Thalassiosira profunda]